MIWITFAILAALVWGIANIADKYILTKWIKNPFVVVNIVAALGLAASILIYFIHGFSNLSNFNIFLALAAGFLYFWSNLTYFKAAQKGDISQIIPLIYLDPLFTTIIAAIFIHEILAPIKYVGILLLVFGAILISTEKLKFKFSKASGFAVLSAFIFAITNVMEKVPLNVADFWTVFAYVRIGVFLGMIVILPFNINALKQTIREIGGKIAYVFFYESFSMLGTLFFMIALSYGYVSLTSTMAAVQPFFVFIFAIIISLFYPHVFKEELDRKTLVTKFVSILLIFLGTTLII